MRKVKPPRFSLFLPGPIPRKLTAHFLFFAAPLGAKEKIRSYAAVYIKSHIYTRSAVEGKPAAVILFIPFWTGKEEEVAGLGPTSDSNPSLATAKLLKRRRENERIRVLFRYFSRFTD